ncbi:DUF6069 family protein [Cryptosporangium aurantiacum]|uniref:Uncharacterized protein n=1 Tax=Cryptosporangium aurantiacum TaxID=134849 RepID=A0A1M7RHR3_9ACTN|nr:DUF6069 family protein [Cryptosporangium aurantiacum]SHN45588.1 hypothetical protein SAMN05443668_112126 [Cryptosporangium aurantiacum]
MTRARHRALAVAGAVLATVVIWVVGEPLLGNDLVFTQPGQDPRDLGPGEIATFASVASLLGWALMAVLERVTRHARSIWTVVALLVLAASFLPVLQIEASGGTKVVLALTHLAVGAVLVPVFWRTATAPSSQVVPAPAG